MSRKRVIEIFVDCIEELAKGMEEVPAVGVSGNSISTRNRLLERVDDFDYIYLCENEVQEWGENLDGDVELTASMEPMVPSDQQWVRLGDVRAMIKEEMSMRWETVLK